MDRALEKDRARRYQSAAEPRGGAASVRAEARARDAVERLTLITKAAGLTDPNFQIPPSISVPASAVRRAASDDGPAAHAERDARAVADDDVEPGDQRRVETAMLPVKRRVADCGDRGRRRGAGRARCDHRVRRSYRGEAKTVTSATASAPITTPAVQSIAACAEEVDAPRARDRSARGDRHGRRRASSEGHAVGRRHALRCSFTSRRWAASHAISRSPSRPTSRS